MSERACARTWTCELRMRDGRLPGLPALAAHIEDIRVGATLRGVEATQSGRLIEEEGQLLLRVSQSGEVLRLSPLTRKVQKDVESMRDEPPTEEERAAYRRLCVERLPRPRGVQVVGPLRESAGGGPRTQEVRSFQWEG